MRIDTGSYTGDGAAGGKTISLTNCSGDLSSTASFVMVFGGNNTNAYWTTDNFSSGYSKAFSINAVAINTVITALGMASFTVADILNTSGYSYYYLALQYDGVTTDIETGSYTGNGSDNQDGLLTYGAWTPDMIIVGSDDDSELTLGRVNDGGTDTQQFNFNAESNNAIKSVNSGYCRLGTLNDVNESGKSFQFVALKNISGYLDWQTYAGNSTDNRDITSLSFQPDFVFITHSNGADVWAKEATTDGTDVSTSLYTGGSSANRIQDILSNGVQVGNSSNVNTTGNDYYLWAFKKYAGSTSSPTIVPIKFTRKRLYNTNFNSVYRRKISIVNSKILLYPTSILQGIIAETLSLADSNLSLAILSSIISESINLSDISLRVANLSANISESMNMVDTDSNNTIFVPQISEIINLTDVVSNIIKLTSSIAENINFSDEALGDIVGALQGIISENLNISDILSSKLSALASISESLNISDSISLGSIIQAVLSDTFNISDENIARLIILASLAETLQLIDESTIRADFSVSINETLQLTDIISKIALFQSILSESFGISDVITEVSQIPNGKVSVSFTMNLPEIGFNLKKATITFNLR